MARLNYPDIGGGGGAPSPLTTKGDLYSHDGSGDVRLPTGANGEFLRANAGEEEGLEWDTIDDDAIKPALNATGDAPLFACRAWVNFDGTTTPPTIRASGNVSSITKSAVGQYRINFADPMVDANYAYCAISSDDNIAGTYVGFNPVVQGSLSATSAPIALISTGGVVDRSIVTVAFYR